MIARALLLLTATVAAGCAAIPAALVLDATVGAVGIVQKYKARDVEREQIDALKEQTGEIVRLREEIQRLREALPAK